MKKTQLIIAVFGACLLGLGASSTVAAEPSSDPTASASATAPPTASEAPKATTKMIQDATFALDPTDASFDLDVGDSTVPLNTSSSEDGKEVIRLVSDLLFGFGSAELSAAASAQLPTILAGIPQANPIQVNGHTDSIGDDASNLTLSQQRAQAVATAITSVRPDLVITVNGLGEADPVAANSNPDGSDNPLGRAENRRVEIIWEG
ncbi:MAG: OmpA family protein [Propionibacteriaceae bacterium]|jgi:outer membrane protein OmpA-like peptidoglycan-associated protein|nr:OmpA family protein [Propionibacteriaceae bacterium]